MAAVVTVRGLASSGFVVNVFSGAVVQSIVLDLLDEPRLHDVRPKPFTVWPLVVNGRVVWNRTLAGAGAAVELRAAFFNGGLADMFAKRVVEAGRFKLFNAEVMVGEAGVRRIVPAAGSSPKFRVEFLSPTRFETPPYVRRPAPVYDITPSPRNLFKSAARTALRLGLIGLRDAVRIYKWAYAAVGVLDYRARPVTVYLSGGRRLRGFVGWALYRAFETSMVGDMWRVLSVAEAFGVGSNRSLGLGAVRITPLE
jgi:CRISPR-associated endoribonuclease Cas6